MDRTQHCKVGANFNMFVDKILTIRTVFFDDVLEYPVGGFTGQLAGPHFNKNNFSRVYCQHSICWLYPEISTGNTLRAPREFTLRRMGLNVSSANK